MTQEEKRKLGIIIALQKYCEEYLEKYKPQLREMTKEEIEELNKNTFFEISRKDSTKTIYPEEYKQEEKALKEKYKDTTIKDTRANYSITFTATSYSKAKTEIIVSNILTCTKTELKNMVASKNKR